MATSVKLLHEPELYSNPTQRLRSVAVVGFLLAVTILLQWLGGAYSGELGAYPDESAHFITGLMIRDYIAAGCPGSPIKYAEQYYLHYPKVAFGMWGPLWHVTEAGWMLVFPANRGSVLVLVALVTTSTAALLYFAVADEFGTVLGLFGALLFLAAPRVQTYTATVMADGLVALLDFSAALAFGRYLNTKQWKHSVQFGVFACLSILTKGNGVALLLLPPLAIAFTRQFGVLKRRAFWVGLAIVIFLAGPWQYYSAKALSPIADRLPGWVFLSTYTIAILTLVGLALLPLVALGVYDRVIAPAMQRSLDGKWAAAAALICSCWVFYCLIPSTGLEQRYLIAVTPPALMFLIAGIHALANLIRIPAVSIRYRAWGVATVVLAVFMLTAFSIPQKQYHGFDRVAAQLERPEYKNSVVLVSSEADGEGMLITETAIREKRPSHILLRATKMLSQSDWMGQHYILRYHTPAEVMEFLQSVPVEIVVIDNERGLGTFPHHALLKQTIAAFANAWELIGAYPPVKPGSQSNIDVFRLKSASGRSGGKIRIDLPYTLGHAIER